ncbi:MAG: poly(R)-hydroxyalkanoic acid synthase subunit PhaE [Cycloclasticus sp.]|nr:hypothetical protein A9Q85_00320 [Cycloclasticus sp. 44_32_T64]
MTIKTDDAFAQFNALINGNMPEQYKELLKNVWEQGLFYQQLVQSVNDNEPDLSKFWDLPNTLGFDALSSEQPEWLQSIFDINNIKANADIPLSDQFAHALSDIPLKIQGSFETVQSSLVKMTSLHNELSVLAMERFQTLKGEATELSTEQLCDNWLKAGEGAFKEISQTDDYIDTQRTLFESLAELKNTQTVIAEQVSGVLGLPSQQTVEDLQTGLHKLRLEFAEYKEDTDAAISKLTQTIQRLK